MKHQLALFYICLHSPDLVLRLAVLWLGRGWTRCFPGVSSSLALPHQPEPLPPKNHCLNASQAGVSSRTKPALTTRQLTVLVFLTISLIIG